MLTRIFNIYLIPTNICETTTQVMTELAEKWENIGKLVESRNLAKRMLTFTGYCHSYSD